MLEECNSLYGKPIRCVNTDGSQFYITVFVHLFMCDYPANAKVLKMSNHNAVFGCHDCEQQSVVVQGVTAATTAAATTRRSSSASTSSRGRRRNAKSTSSSSSSSLPPAEHPINDMRK